MNSSEMTTYKMRALDVLTRHMGKERAIGAAELYEKVFPDAPPWKDKITSTRPLRRVIQALREGGTPICSTRSNDAGGYYLPATASELEDYLQREHNRAVRILARIARARQTTLPALLGQMQMQLQGKRNAA